jgi:hypothetical protein
MFEPLDEGPGINTMLVRETIRLPRVFLLGKASRSVERITIRVDDESAPPIEAVLVTVPSGLAYRLGASRPFQMFVAALPAGTETCSGVSVIGSSPTSGRVWRERLNAANTFPRGAHLPGSPRCIQALMAPLSIW